jgi:hypothetical protein
VIPALGKLRQNCEFKACLGYIETLSQEIRKERERERRMRMRIFKEKPHTVPQNTGRTAQRFSLGPLLKDKQRREVCFKQCSACLAGPKP